MKRVHTFLIAALLFMTINILSLAFSYAASFKAEIYPRRISPGDAFRIKVTGGQKLQLPSASLAGKTFYFTGCGENCFVAIGAIDLNAKTGGHSVKVTAGTNQRSVRLSVKKTRFPELRITLPEEKVTLSPEDLEVVKKENERLKAIFQTVSTKLWEGDFIRPLENDTSTVFGAKRIMNGKMISIHRGMDIKGCAGEEVRASNSGRIVLAEELFFGGNTVIIDHGQGIYTVYMHLSKLSVKPDSIVLKGDVIGLVGSTGRSTGPHLHFGVKVQDMNINPVSLLKLQL
jgi:murein DD-endopeptidase MepM/ murein hydrolase activator NlpD